MRLSSFSDTVVAMAQTQVPNADSPRKVSILPNARTNVSCVKSWARSYSPANR